jgi:glycosyltransferase involved in cell wall biosynthesis
MNKQDKIIYISPKDTSFTRKDIDILAKRYRVATFPQDWSKKGFIVPNLFRQFFFLLWNMPKSTAAFVMFGGYWSLFPALLGKLFRKPVFIILGGMDCVSFPEYKYGSLRKPWLRKLVKGSYSLAKMLLPVDESLVCSDYSYDKNVKAKKQGFKHYFPTLSIPYRVIHMGFDANYWHLNKAEKKPWLFTTIGTVQDLARFHIKGIDLVIELAYNFPGQEFHIVGMNHSFSKSLGEYPDNVIMHDYIKIEDLMTLLRESQFYLQLSISEGFPNALCEAMLCECIPIVSKVGAMPFIVKDSGFIIEDRDINLVVQNISKALNYSPDELKTLGEKARMQVKDRFTIGIREKEFFRLLDNEIP